jgi:antitoxin HigA-1
VNPEHVRKIGQILAALYAAQTIEALDLPTFRLHPLTAISKAFGQSQCARIGGSFSNSRTAKLSTSILLTTIEGGKNMEMKNPPHPGELIGDNLTELGVSISAAAKALGITRQHLHNLISGRSGITPEMAVKLEKAIGSTADTWLRMQMNYDLAQVRKREASIKVSRLAPV